MIVTIKIEIADDTEYPYETVPMWEVLIEGLLERCDIEYSSVVADIP